MNRPGGWFGANWDAATAGMKQSRPAPVRPVRRASAHSPGKEPVRQARAGFIQGAGLKPDFSYDLLLMFARNELSAQATLLLLAMIFSLASCFWAPWTQAGLWLLLVIAAKVVLLEICRRFQADSEATAHVDMWHKRFFMAEALNGCAWAGFVLVGINTIPSASHGELLSSHVFIFASLMVVLAIRMTFASPVMSILLIGTIPMTFAVVARLVLLNEYFFLALASMAVGVQIYFIFLAQGLNSTAVAMLEYRSQKDSLIAELEEATAISDMARKRAEDANIAKSKFLATMSHELRTPLNAILGFSEVMKDQIMGPIDNQTYRDYVASIHDSGSHLLKLINEILDLSRIEAGRYELNEEAVRLADIAADCEELLRLRAEAKNIQVFPEFAERLPHIWVDQRAIRQIFLNLLSNALKFTPPGGRVVIAVAATSDGGQSISIRDNGPGIPADEIPKVMQAFGQGSLAHQTAEGGTGLGLPIVKKLAELHGGTFDLKSELRKGTQAIVSLPPSRVLRPMLPSQLRGAERHKLDAQAEMNVRPAASRTSSRVTASRPARLRRMGSPPPAQVS